MDQRIPPAPAPGYIPPEPPERRMLHAAITSLAEISEALGIPDEEAQAANGNDLILEAIAELRQRAGGTDYKALYEDAMAASNEAGFVGMTAAETIRRLSADLDANGVTVLDCDTFARKSPGDEK